jgi:hypothetical protein
MGCSGVSNGAQLATSGGMSGAPVNRPERRPQELRQPELRNHNSLGRSSKRLVEGFVLQAAAFGMASG